MCQTSSACQLVHFLVDWKASNLSFIQLKGTNSSIVRGKLTFKAQEKFQNPHFGFKKGNNWDFKGISLGKPKIGKVLPKPSMGF